MYLTKYGYAVPEAGDESSTEWQPDLSNNIKRYSDHRHDGVDSAKISFASIQKVTSVVYQASWSAYGNGEFKAVVNMPSGYSFDNTNIIFTIVTPGHIGEDTRIFPTIHKITNTSFEIYSNDNTIDVGVMFV